MQIRFSLLYPDPEKHIDDSPLVEHIASAIEDISLDQAIDRFARDSDGYTYTLDVLRRPLEDPEEILYRQQVLQDFIAQPGLLDELRLLFKSYDTLETTWRELRSSVFLMGMPASAEGILDSTYDSLKITADFARKTASYFNSVRETIEKYQVASPGLAGIRDYCDQMIQNQSMQRIAQIAGLFQRSTAEDYQFKVFTQNDDTLRVIRASVMEVRELEAKTFSSRVKKLAQGLTRSGQDQTPAVDLGSLHDEDARNLLSKALYELYTVLGSVAEAVYNLFRGISGELCFYDTGVRFWQYCKASGLSCCYPELLPMEADTFQVTGLYDVHLPLDGLRADQITPMEFDFHGIDGVIIRGPSATGKTASLRAMGMTQLFAQAGLPVCAASARLSIRGGIFTQFSAAERDFDANDEAGRFEGEVKEMARILDALAPWSLVLLNETFQTTAYTEGMEGMQGILECLPALGCRYAFVTQMSIYKNLDPARVTVLDFEKVFHRG